MKHFIINQLNIKEDYIQSIESTLQNETHYIHITLRSVTSSCPFCSHNKIKIKDYRSISLNFPIHRSQETILVYRQRRYQCLNENCRKTFSEQNLFKQANRKISNVTITETLKLLKDYTVTFSFVARQLNISTTSVINIFDEYINLPRSSLTPIICLDEVYAFKSYRSSYCFVIADFRNGKILDVLPSRKLFDLYSYFNTYEQDELNTVKLVCIDMYDNYKRIANKFFKNAIVAVDSFHVIKLINDALMKVRLRVMKELTYNSIEYRALKKYPKLLFVNSHDFEGGMPMYNKLFNKKMNRLDILRFMCNIHTDIEKAHNMKDLYATFNANLYVSLIEVNDELEYITAYFAGSNVSEFVEVSKTLRKWKTEIVHSFYRIDGRRISNGPIESINGRIKALKILGKGYGSFERFKQRIFYSINKSDHYTTIKK